MRRLPPLTAIRAFEGVGRFGIQRAAAELNVTPAAIYHQIRALEADLEVQLFTRNKGKGLMLTLQGEQYLAEVINIFDQLYTSVNRIRSDSYRNELTVDGVTSFVGGFIVPRLHRFVADNPDIDLKFITPHMPGRVRFAQTGAHVAIRGGAAAAQWPDLHAEMLVHETMFPVCAPSLLEGPDGLREPADLKRVQLLDVVGAPEGWSGWLEEAEAHGHDTSGVHVDQAVKFDLIQHSMQAAAEGLGVDLGRAPLVDHLLETGRLVAPFDIKIRSTLSYWLIAPPQFTGTDQFKRFRDWLRSELSESRYVDESLGAT